MLRPFPADDAALHVVGGQLDDADGRLGRVACGDALQRVGDEGPRAPLRVGSGLLLELAHGARELVPDQVLRSLEELLARLAERQPADALELAEHLVVPRLELLLELLRVRLPVGDSLFAPRELLGLRIELGLALVDALLDLRHLHAAGLDLALDLRAQRSRPARAPRSVPPAGSSRPHARRRRAATAADPRRGAAVTCSPSGATPTGRRRLRAIPITTATAVSMDDPFGSLSRGGGRGCSHPDTACTAASR